MSHEDRAGERSSGRLSRTAVLGVLVLVGALLLVPLPQTTRAATAAFDLLHAPLFAVLAFGLASVWKSKRQVSTARVAVLVWIGLALAGGMIEWLQELVERFPSWRDALANMLGAGAGSLAFVAAHSRRSASIAAVCAALVLMAFASWHPAATLFDCYRQGRDPSLLASFEDELELSRWSADEATIGRSPKYASHGDSSLRVDLTTGMYPGISSRHLPRDWSAYEELLFHVTLDEGPELILITKVYDEAHDMETHDRFHASTRLIPGTQRVGIPLGEIEAAPRDRRMDLTRIVCLQFFTVRPETRRTLHLDNIRLE